jgi:hypothetical protein
MIDVSELRKREIADQFADLVRDSVSVFEAADILATKYGMSRPEILAIVKEIKGSL